jgi:Na+-translocating ferredoxin:NAD+ oxidoreductase RnfG subunit
MNMICSNRFYPVIIVIIPILIAIALGFSSCGNTLILEDEAETLSLLQQVFLEASYYHYDEEAEIYTVYDADKAQIGYAFYAEGNGHGGLMIFLVGLKDKETFAGITVIKHSENHGGIGDMPGPPLDFSPLTEQFVGLKIEDCYLKNDFGLVDGITGASYSSRKTVDIIRETALTKFKPMESEIEWQNILTLSIVIPFILIPVVFIWYATIKQARAKRVLLRK